MKNKDLAIKGFNAGYLIEKFNPNLSASLSKGIKENDNPYVLGFLLGRIKLVRELEKGKFQELNVKSKTSENKLDELDLD
ncbi:MAG: hypothetical protein DWQ02_21110 [Bacteroidetes bacterium]|nr:MAG: hypothetical protein DWQ02_21110 [Bacteroidota bacterium]